MRKIRQMVNEAFQTDFGRPSITPEQIIRASLVQILFPVRVPAGHGYATAPVAVFLAQACMPS